MLRNNMPTCITTIPVMFEIPSPRAVKRPSVIKAPTRKGLILVYVPYPYDEVYVPYPYDEELYVIIARTA